VVGGVSDKKSTKQVKAEKYNAAGSSIQIITEDAFITMLEEEQ